ncbi:MAG: polyhydroxyalkanoate synthesis repressor PhaR [Proteobacteria bacterium]|nr:polyhydroxyalkanoate synthesis repressor PhaR [Pseudomonadota bacterium]
MDEKQDSATVTIKKYANRRLYNTATSSYVTLENLCQMVKDGVDFVVVDAKTGEDITRSVLTQIIVEEESRGPNLLPIGFLRQLIRYYDDSLQAFLPRYLEVSMETFTRNQEEMRDYMRQAFDGLSPFTQFEELGRQNLTMVQRAFDKFGAAKPQGDGMNGAPGEGDVGDDDVGDDDELSRLKGKLDAMQKQLDELSRKNRGAD